MSATRLQCVQQNPFAVSILIDANEHGMDESMSHRFCIVYCTNITSDCHFVNVLNKI